MRFTEARSRFAVRCTLIVSIASNSAGCDTGPSFDAAAAARGKVVAQSCQTCHSFENQNKIGPHLGGVLGRTAGTVPGYEFSASMRNSKIVWTAENLEQFLQSPLKMVPGAKMALSPLTAEQSSDVVEYIKSQD